MHTTIWSIVVGFWLTFPPFCNAETLLIAVASNFKPTAQLLAKEFNKTGATNIKFSSASTGVLYAQIRQGAPFDVFLAADTQHVQALQDAGLAQPNTRLTYAVGALVLVADKEHSVDANLAETLKNLHAAKQRIAIANPASAPYGRAAREVLQKLGVWQDSDKNLIRSSNIAQSLQHVSTRSVSAALTARSLLPYAKLRDDLAIITVPQRLYAPIRQQGIALRSAANGEQAKLFVQFLASDAARELISDSGYLLPDVPSP